MEYESSTKKTTLTPQKTGPVKYHLDLNIIQDASHP